MRSLPALLLLACSPTQGPAAVGTDSGDSGVFGDCDPTVQVAVGLFQDGDPMLGTPHAETYGAEPTPYAVRLGWPSRDPSRSVSMLWRTDLDTLASTVELGPADTFPEGATQLPGASFLFGGPTGEVGEGDYRIHEARLCGLVEPDTTYSYRVGGEGSWSETYTFTTPPTPGTRGSYRVAWAGDSRGAYATWENLLAAIDETEPDLIMFSGDMVEFGSLQSEWDSWFQANGDVFARRPMLAAHGNHEFMAQHYFAQFSFPGNEQWFAFELGDLLLLTLNDTVSVATDIEVQAAFLDEELSATGATWKLANHHQPPYSSSSAHSSNMTLREAWTPVYEAHGVDLVVAGHNHLYERSVPIAGDAAQADGEGVIYLVSGGAGAPIYEGTETEWFNVSAAHTEHFVIGDFSAAGADFVVKDLEGNLLDEFSIPKP